ncbi:hypothetical protein Bbelb_235160 [Branchiostoma belcheri]|nr:hypothetical protein Bbelb_235160 [Branchiostoma belcheri]
MKSSLGIRRCASTPDFASLRRSFQREVRPADRRVLHTTQALEAEESALLFRRAVCLDTASLLMRYRNKRKVARKDRNVYRNGVLKPTPLPALYRLAERFTLGVRSSYRNKTQDTLSTITKTSVARRLKSRRRFMLVQNLNPKDSATYRLDQWRTTVTLLLQTKLYRAYDCELGPSVTKRDLYDANQEALDWLEQWADKI